MLSQKTLELHEPSHYLFLNQTPYDNNAMFTSIALSLEQFSPSVVSLYLVLNADAHNLLFEESILANTGLHKQTGKVGVMQLISKLHPFAAFPH